MSEVWTTSAMARFAPASCMTFWKMRWEPSRVSSHVTPTAFLLKASHTFWATDSPSDEYQTTLPSFLAASRTAGSAASARATKACPRASPIRSPQHRRRVIISPLSFLSVSRGAPESRGRGRDVGGALDLDELLKQHGDLHGGESPGRVDPELQVQLLGRQRILPAAPRRVLRLFQYAPVAELHAHVPGEALRVRHGRVEDVADLPRHFQDTRVSGPRVVEPVDPGLSLHQHESDA